MRLPSSLTLILLCTAAICASLRAQQTQQSSPTGPVIRVSSNLVYVGVNVTDGSGHFIPRLRQKDFEIFDNGVHQPIAQFASDEDPAQVVILIEESAIDWLMAKMNRSLLVDADALVARIPPQDRVAILTYAQRTEVVSDFTADKGVTRGVLKQLNEEFQQSGAVSSSLDLSASLDATLDWLSASHGSKTIILFSSGFDSTTPEAWQRIHQRLAASDVRILAVSVFGDLRVPEKKRHLSADQREDRAFLKEGITAGDESLEQVSLLTGGRAFLPKNIKEFDRDCLSVSELIRGQYTLAFVPTAFDGRFHTIDVKLKHHFGSHIIEHRQGYVAAAPSSR